MNVDILLGLQWGDEGKGKIVDVLTPDYDVIARFQGGPNAGHSLEFDNSKYVLHTIPSGIFHEGKVNLIGSGVVIDPSVFKREIESLNLPIEELTRRLVISNRAHLILPTHRILDATNEKLRGKLKIGSTLKGIGPAYTDKTSRYGMRAGDILKKNFMQMYEKQKMRHLEVPGTELFTSDLKKMEEEWMEGILLLKKFQIISTEYLLDNMLKNRKRILAEGAQGTLLDVDFGSYPFVTSSNTIAAGAFTGLGIGPSRTGDVYGIFKAYCTRVGSGPFPTELEDTTGSVLRDKGREFGSTTGRPRRCGWLDLPALKYSIMINGVTRLLMMKADVMSGFETVKICTSYSLDGKETTEVPYDIESNITPVYKEFKGWNEDLTAIRIIQGSARYFKRLYIIY